MRQAVVCSSPGVVYSWYLWQGMGLGGTCSKSKPTPQEGRTLSSRVRLVVGGAPHVPERASCSGQRSADRRESASSEVPDPESCCIGPCLAVAVMAVVFLDDDAQGR